jgi:hypothetical protein
MAGVIWWALVVGPDQAGGSYVGRFVLAVCLTALVRLLLGVKIVRTQISGMFVKLGMIGKPAPAPQP